jgi:basic membrane lipoprotein Med (substrate-binding protein (PBP1-ABC) superfamily)
MSYLGPQILASVVKRFDRATQLAVKLFATGQLPGGQDLQLDLASGNIGLVGISARVPPTVRAKVEALAAKLLARDQARDSH